MRAHLLMNKKGMSKLRLNMNFLPILSTWGIEYMFLLKKNYKFSLSIRLTASEMHLVDRVVDIGPPPNLIREEIFEPELLISIQATNRPLLKKATSQTASVVRVIALHVHKNSSRVREVFGVLRPLMEPVRLEIPFINRFGNGYFFFQTEYSPLIRQAGTDACHHLSARWA